MYSMYSNRVQLTLSLTTHRYYLVPGGELFYSIMSFKTKFISPIFKGTPAFVSLLGMMFSTEFRSTVFVFGY
jgi:hypothetical protein